MTAPSERLTPQQMQAEWRVIGASEIWRSALLADDAKFIERALAAWQADRETLERTEQRLAETPEQGAFIRAAQEKLLEHYGALLRRARTMLSGAIEYHGKPAPAWEEVLAELDAATGETK